MYLFNQGQNHGTLSRLLLAWLKIHLVNIRSTSGFLIKPAFSGPEQPFHHFKQPGEGWGGRGGAPTEHSGLIWETKERERENGGQYEDPKDGKSDV